MERAALDDLEPTGFGDGAVRHELTESLDAEHVAINRYRLPPGAGFPGGLHAHFAQEEVFLVLEGAATFETLDGDRTVAAGEAVRFAPGEYQSGRNDGDVVLVVLALGAPRDAHDTRIPFACPDCGFEGLRLATAAGDPTFGCPDCGAVHAPAPCPACGGSALSGTIDHRDDPGVACRDCGATFASPPIED